MRKKREDPLEQASDESSDKVRPKQNLLPGRPRAEPVLERAERRYR